MKNYCLCHAILFWELFFKIILALKSRKLFDTTEAKKKTNLAFISYLSEIRSYQKKVLSSNFSDKNWKIQILA